MLFFSRAGDSDGGTSVGHVVIGGRVVDLIVWTVVCLDGFVVAESDAKAKNRNL